MAAGKKIMVMNGPNLNLLGVREKSIYGDQGFESYFEELKPQFPEMELSYFQSNHEGELIDKLHEIGFEWDGIVLNAGGFTHSSVALRDAIAAINAPVIEVHISNIHAREPFREKSLLTAKCAGIIAGLGLNGYRLALHHLA